MSNKSLFNIVLIKKDLKLLLPIILINLISSVLIYPYKVVQVIYEIKKGMDFESAMYAIRSINNNFEALPLILIVTIVCSISLFAGEKNRKTIELFCVMPFSRKQIYVNKIVTGIGSIIVPNIVVYFITYLIVLSDKLLISLINIEHFKNILIIFVLTQLVVFSYYIMISMLFGSVLSTFICGTIFTFFPVAYFIMLGSIMDYTFDKIMNIAMKITPIVILVEAVEGEHNKILLSLLAYTFIFIIAGYYLFEMYKMEKNSEFLTFKWTEPVFKIGLFIASVLLCANIMSVILYEVSSFTFLNKMIGAIIGAVVGYIIPIVLIKRNKAV